MIPLVVTILPTRECNLKCSYCKIRDNEFSNELSWQDWVKVLKKLNNQYKSICFNVLLGGDITCWGDNLIKFVAQMSETDIPWGFTTNGLLLPFMTNRLKKAGLTSVSLSMDTLGTRKDGSEDIKSMNTREMLPSLVKAGFTDLHCTITVDKTNLEEVPTIVEYLTTHKTYSEITPMLFGKNKYYDYTSSYGELKDRLLTVDDRDRINEIMGEVIQMKKAGHLVHNTDYYLRYWSNLGIKQNWYCGYPVGLVADADGSMRVCLQIKGKRVPRHNISDFNEKDFLHDWHKDYKECCEGCYWNCHVESEFIYQVGNDVDLVREYYCHNVKEVEKVLGIDGV